MTPDELRTEVENLRRMIVVLILAHGQPLDDSGDGFGIDLPTKVLLEQDRWELVTLPCSHFAAGMRLVAAKVPARHAEPVGRPIDTSGMTGDGGTVS